jgi:hypothetical protein
MVGTCSSNGINENCVQNIGPETSEKSPRGTFRHKLRIIFKRILEKYGLKIWAEFDWIRTGSICGLKRTL